VLLGGNTGALMAMATVLPAANRRQYFLPRPRDLADHAIASDITVFYAPGANYRATRSFWWILPSLAPPLARALSDQESLHHRPPQHGYRRNLGLTRPRTLDCGCQRLPAIARSLAGRWKANLINFRRGQHVDVGDGRASRAWSCLKTAEGKIAFDRSVGICAGVKADLMSQSGAKLAHRGKV
jgi:hypothetical protein